MWSLYELIPDLAPIQIVDIGAMLTEKPPYQSLVEAKRCRVVGFEPNQAECDRLNQTYGPPHRFFPYFIGDGKPGVFHETSWAPTCSLLEPNVPLLRCFQQLEELVKPVAQHRVSTARLDDFDSITDVDFIKIDVQGGELMVFENAQRILRDTLLIQTEVNFVQLYKNQPLFADVDIFLRSLGFQLHRLGTVSMRVMKPFHLSGDPPHGGNQALWADALYTRDFMRLGEIPADKLRKMAAVLHDLFFSVDLANLALATADQREGTNHSSAYLGRLMNRANQS